VELVKKGVLAGNKMYPLIVNHRFGQIDIDTKEDMELAEYYLKKHYNYE
jgi:N-acylneuraminate cytidylyltransferase